MSFFSKILFNLGVFCFLIILLFWIKPLLPFLDFLGKLPGDLILKIDDLYFYLPIVSSLLISLLLSFVDYLFFSDSKPHE